MNSNIYPRVSIEFTAEEAELIRKERKERIKLFPKKYHQYFSTELYNKIKKTTITIPNIIKFFDNGFFIISNECPVCGTEKNLSNFACSQSCCKQMNFYKEKVKATCLEKYGVENPGQSSEIQEKMRKTNFERYGVENPSCLSIINKKKKKTFAMRTEQQKIKTRNARKTTNLEQYGVEHTFQSKEIQNKIKTTFLERYGVQNPMQNKEIKEKTKKTNLERYGGQPCQSKEIKEKVKATCLEKYGVEYVTQSAEFQEKMKNTNLERYGVEIASQSKEVQEKMKNTLRKSRYPILIKQLENTHYVLLDTYEQFLTSEEHVYYCTKHNIEFKSYKQDLQRIHCPTCLKEAFIVTKGHQEIVDFLKEYLPEEDIIINDRNVLSGKELDIFIPKFNLAIEFNGLYWHSNLFKEKNFHLEKTETCSKLGISLVHVFESEWNFQKEIVKSIILSKLGIFSERIFARKCTIQEVSIKEAREFLEENHLQGYTGCSRRLGLYYNNKLVEIITIGSSRFKKSETELIRHCTKLNTQVIGGFSKLIKASGISNIVSYVDRRYFNGSGYEATGWTQESISAPNYFYIVDGSLESRIKYQKYKLKNLLKNFYPEYSEQDNMSLNGYTWIHDCGNFKYRLKQ